MPTIYLVVGMNVNIVRPNPRGARNVRQAVIQPEYKKNQTIRSFNHLNNLSYSKKFYNCDGPCMFLFGFLLRTEVQFQ